MGDQFVHVVQQKLFKGHIGSIVWIEIFRNLEIQLLKEDSQN